MRITRPTRLKAIGAAALLALPACAPKQPSAAQRLSTLEQLEAGKIAYLDGVIATHQRIQDELAARCVLEYERAVAAGGPDDRTFDVLILSGGGAKGAFGAGFLLGWGEVNDPAMARPEFDLVTGVSTGSLIAPLAFLGDEESYALADHLYRNPSASWIEKRGLLDVLFTQQSLFTDQGLFKDVSEKLSPRIPAIAREQAEHRVLLIGATNLNQGDSHIWNLTDLATQVQDGSMTADEFCRHCISSASIPVAFPPQLIDGNLYVDGSTTRDILYLMAFDTRNSALQTWRQDHPGVPLPMFRVWVIANTSLVTPPVAVDPKDLAVVGRSLALSVESSLLTQLKNLEFGTRILREEVGVPCEFRFVSMPDGYAPKGPGMFNRDDMDEMSNMGRAMGRDPSSWRTTVPDPLAPTALREEMARQLREQQAADTGARSAATR